MSKQQNLNEELVLDFVKIYSKLKISSEAKGVITSTQLMVAANKTGLDQYRIMECVSYLLKKNILEIDIDVNLELYYNIPRTHLFLRSILDELNGRAVPIASFLNSDKNDIIYGSLVLFSTEGCEFFKHEHMVYIRKKI